MSNKVAFRQAGYRGPFFRYFADGDGLCCSSILTMKRLATLENGTASERKRRKATGLRVQLRQRGYQHGFRLKHHSLAYSVSTSLDSAVDHHTLFRAEFGTQGNTCDCGYYAPEPAFRVEGSVAFREEAGPA